MASSGSLQHTLRSLDGSAPSVKNAASAMMKHYDRTAAVAVTEWRNVLSTTTSSQHLISLLYVANEVLQISKRNRGNKFLEAFSGILGQALTHICSQDPSLTEKVRRTVKIWGERRVFSVRFVHDLISGLESFRSQAGSAPSAAAGSRSTGTTNSGSADAHHNNLPSARPTFQRDDDGATFSPIESNPSEAASTAPSSETKTSDQTNDDDDEGDIMDILEAQEKAKEEEGDDDDDDHDIFRSDNQLNLDLDLDQVGAKESDHSSSAQKTSKRRSSTASNGSTGKRRRRNSSTGRTTLSTNSLLELASSVAKLQDDFEESQRTLERIDRNLAKTSAEELEQVVGDELLVEFRQIVRYQEQIVDEKKRLYDIAQKRKGLEQEAIAYLPWLEKALQQDAEDINFCTQLQKDLEAFLPIHKELKKARDIRRAEEQKRIEMEAEKDRIRKEKEENERFRQESLKRQTEQNDGMVWNPTTREYQQLDTNESWRD